MPMVSCRECAASVSDAAASCPSCGVRHPAAEAALSASIRRDQVIGVSVALVAIVVFVLVLAYAR